MLSQRKLTMRNRTFNLARKRWLCAITLLPFLMLWACLPAGCTSLTSPASNDLSATVTVSAEPGAQAMTPPAGGPAEGRAVVITGIAVPDVWVDLSFSRDGVVESTLVSEGQRVTAGQVLIRLNADDLELTLKQAEAVVATAQARLAQLKAPSGQAEVAAVQTGAAVAAAEARLAQLKAPPRQEDIAVAQAAVDQAEANLEASRARLANAEAAVGAAEADLNTSRAILAGSQAALNIVQAEPDPRELEIAQLVIERAENERWVTYLERDALAGRPGIPGYLLDEEKATVSSAEAAVRIAELEYEQLSAAPTADEISRVQADVSAAEASVAGAEARLVQARAQLDEIRAQVDASEASLEQAQAELASLLAGPTPEEIAVAEAAVKEAELAYLLAEPTPEQIAVLEAEVKEAQAGLAIAQASLRQAELVAPFSGTVTGISVREGESVSRNQSMIVLADLDQLHVESFELDELSLTRIGIDDQVEVTFDALPTARLSGRVGYIGLRGTSTEEGTLYKVVIQLNEQISEIRWGMLAQIEIRP